MCYLCDMILVFVCMSLTAATKRRNFKSTYGIKQEIRFGISDANALNSETLHDLAAECEAYTLSLTLLEGVNFVTHEAT